MDMIGESVTDLQLNEMLAIADIDHDGKINYEGKYSEVLIEVSKINSNSMSHRKRNYTRQLPGIIIK
jgi:Ca2+-binding EF-hand superfamily protein